jgi:hypothetical protein
MPKVVNFYVDDSGTRKPNLKPIVFDPSRQEHFALGGILIDEADEGVARSSYEAFCAKWQIGYPLHSEPMRHGTGDFRWLRRSAPEYAAFMRDLTQFLTSIPVLGLACVVDRPGYDARYRAKYGRNQWQLCRTAFSIVVERAAKHAMNSGCKLRVLAERCSKADDRRIERYYQELRESGHPFDKSSAAAYAPLAPEYLRETLYELRFKAKSSPMIQVADLFLWPMIRQRYRPPFRPYTEFAKAGRIIDCRLSAESRSANGCKYSCFELVDERR